MTPVRRLVLCIGFAGFAAACGPQTPEAVSPEAGKTPPADSGTAVVAIGTAVAGSQPSGTAAAGPAPAGTGKGLAASGNDPALLALAKKVLECGWTQENGVEYDCAAREAWEGSEILEKGAPDATLVNFLEDSRWEVRWLGATSLSHASVGYREDKSLAERVLAAAETEKVDSVLRHLARAVGAIRLGKVGLAERAKAFGRSPTAKAVRVAFLSQVQFANSELFYPYTVDLAKTDPDNEIRDAAMSSFWTGTPSDKTAEVCQLWLDLSHDKNEDLAAHAGYFASYFPFDEGCKAQWDTLLGDVEKRAKAGTAKSTYWATALSNLYDQKAASPAQKKKAIATAKSMAENKANDGSARSRALDVVAEKDAGGKAFVKKFAKDSDPMVKAHAETLLAAKPK